MFQNISNHTTSGCYGEKKYRLADYFNQYWDTYAQKPEQYITPEQYKAVNAIRVCRTPALGVDVYACEDCGELTEVYHSCKNRFCPTCSWQDTVNWAKKIKLGMMDIPHRHVVFTLPHQLHPVIKANKKALFNILMRTSADTLKDWILHKYKLNCGIIMVLHTFGEKKDLHVHVHMIVSWGGIDQKTGALIPIKGKYVNYPFLKKKFRIKFEDELVAMYNSGELTNDFKNEIDFKRFLKQSNEKHWIINFEDPMDSPEAVIRYIGRYSKRACLSEYKITDMSNGYISFRYKNYKKKEINNKPIEEILELHYSKFFPRLLQHVPLPYFKIVRYYGLYSNRGKIPEQYLYKEPEEQKEELPESWETIQLEKKGENPMICNTCNKRKVYQYTKFKKRNGNAMVTYIRKILSQMQFIEQQVA